MTMGVTQSAYEELFAKGVAVGMSDVFNDQIVFKFKEEVFEVPTVSSVGIATYNGYFYTAKVDKLRGWEKKDGE